MSAKLTPYGVCYDLSDSPFTFRVGGYQFNFSSVKHMEAFKAKRGVKTEWLSDSLSRRFKMPIDASLLAIFQLYNQVETRGFFVHDLMNGVIYTAADQIKFDVVRNYGRD